MGRIFAGMIIGVIGVGYTKLVYKFGKSRGENKSDLEWIKAFNKVVKEVEDTILNNKSE